MAEALYRLGSIDKRRLEGMTPVRARAGLKELAP